MSAQLKKNNNSVKNVSNGVNREDKILRVRTSTGGFDYIKASRLQYFVRIGYVICLA
jgi:hypothetical protein